MKWVRSCGIAFSMYSRIPMPQFDWREEDQRLVLCFFPWVGAVIGLGLMLWRWICLRLGIGFLAYLLAGTALPVLVTGGFHVDGFLDTMDALHSYQSRERKLEILKDSHIGAFSVIMLLVYYLLYLAGFSEIRDFRSTAVMALGFVISRCLSGIGVMTIPNARGGGMLWAMSSHAEKQTVLAALYVQFGLAGAAMLACGSGAGVLALAAAVGSFVFYRRRCEREFGGITGDTAGYFVLLCELAVTIAAARGGRF